MSDFRMSGGSGFAKNDRLREMQARYNDLIFSGRRRDMNQGELRAWIDAGPFPCPDKAPSAVQGYRADGEQWGEDFEFLLDAMQPNINPAETIVGEIYWEMECIRPQRYENAAEVDEKREAAARLNAMPFSRTHTCPDIAIVLREGYDGILTRIRKYRDLYTKLKNERRARYLRGMEHVCMGCIRYIERYAELAERMAAEAACPAERERLRGIAQRCRNVAHQAPASFHEAIQATAFAVLFDHAVAHGNGYGRLDLLLIDFYRQDVQKGLLTREEARNCIAEMYLKTTAFFFGLGGRLEDGSDAVSEMSWVALEAYDMIGISSNIGVMWHQDIDADFYDYACDVLARHGEATPVLFNYDVMYASLLRSGVPAKDAWKASYSGCQWYAIPGMEYCGHDTNILDALRIMMRALQRAAQQEIGGFDGVLACFREELRRSLDAFQAAEAAIDRVRGDGMPEIYGAMLSHGPIERGLDITAPRGVDYQYTSINIQGLPNIADSLLAIRRLVFEQHIYTLREVMEACSANWENREGMRQRFLNQPKFGNGTEDADRLYAGICDMILDLAEGYVNQRGGLPLRPCLYCYMNHLEDKMPATPDGRRSGDVFAHGINPQLGASRRGLIPMLNSTASADMRKYDGGSIQIELQPKFFDGKEEHYAYIRNLSSAYFASGGMQINMNIMDLKKLEDAIAHPERPEYRDLTVRVTGYSARFLALPERYQREFVSRENYENM